MHCEIGIAHHGGVADPVDGLDAVHDTDRAQSSPTAGGEDASVDLEVEVAVRVTGAGGVVPYDGGLELLDRDLDLSAPRSDPGGGVVGKPADDLLRCPFLGCVVGGGDLRVQRPTTPSTNPRPRSSVRSRPFGLPVLTS